VEPLYIVIIGLVVLVAVYFLFIRKPEAPKQIEKAPEPKKLQDKKPAAESETPQKSADKPAKPEVKKASVKQPTDEATRRAASRTVEGTRERRFLRSFEGAVRWSKRSRSGPRGADRRGAPDLGRRRQDDGRAPRRRSRIGSSEASSRRRGASGSVLRTRGDEILGIGGGHSPSPAKPTVVMVVGVNGAGKTTTIGKLATRLQGRGQEGRPRRGRHVPRSGRAAAQVWGKRVGCEVVSGKDGANPGAVIFDAIQRAKEIGADVVLADTAGASTRRRT
jgi:fused signal recognition particle receptor